MRFRGDPGMIRGSIAPVVTANLAPGAVARMYEHWAAGEFVIVAQHEEAFSFPGQLGYGFTLPDSRAGRLLFAGDAAVG